MERAKPIEEGGVVCFQQYDSKVEIESLKVNNHWFALWIENAWPSLDNHSCGYQLSTKLHNGKSIGALSMSILNNYVSNTDSS